LERGLETNGLRVEDITDLLVTHIHLDHAGAAGWLAQHGVRVHVHHRGSAHMQNPGKLLASAKRIYGDQMDALWGEFLPVPEEQLNILHDGDEIIIHGLHFKAIDTPGHANHHMAYVLGKTCFAGDVGGVRLPGPFHLQLPMPPPDLDLKKWRTSVERLKAADIQRIALTHFGIY
ncbi:MAG: MBL fold metallo-hydrolase, partial [Chloroflexi bacterium]|nr:MBL fold metallo-hydrolase [Chloroflexota bacterium]